LKTLLATFFQTFFSAQGRSLIAAFNQTFLKASRKCLLISFGTNRLNFVNGWQGETCGTL
jgi:hypothetical protein